MTLHDETETQTGNKETIIIIIVKHTTDYGTLHASKTVCTYNSSASNLQLW